MYHHIFVSGIGDSVSREVRAGATNIIKRGMGLLPLVRHLVRAFNKSFAEGGIDEDSPIKRETHKTKPPNRRAWEEGKGVLLLTPENRGKYRSRDIRENIREHPIKVESTDPVINKGHIRDYRTRHKVLKSRLKHQFFRNDQYY